MFKKKYIPILLEMYPIDIYIFLNYKEKDKKGVIKKILKTRKKGKLKNSKLYKNSIKELVNNLDLNDALGWTTSHRGSSIIFINKFNKKDFASINTLIHESVHATANAGRYIVMPLGEDSEEFYAYLIGHIVKTVMDKLKKK